MKDIDEFLKKYHIKTSNRDLYKMAFTHASFNIEAKTNHHDYERLEFMGDSVLGFVVASLLFKIHPELREGDLTKAKSTLVQTKALAKYARKLNYGDYIIIGHSLNRTQALANDSLFEDIFEASLGAMYLDQGIDFVANFIENVLLEDIKNFSMDEVKDYKSMLQEMIQCEHRESVTYKTVNQTGPDHDKTFYVDVVFHGIILGHGKGKSKKEAEQKAAYDALNKKATL